MPDNLIPTLITVAGSLLGAIVTLFIPKPENWSQKPAIWVTVGSVFGAMTTILVLFYLGLLQINSVSSLYDDFDNSDYNGEVNQRLWTTGVVSPSYVEQENGMLTINIEPNSGEIATAFAQKKIRLNRDIFVESRAVLSGKVVDGQYMDIGLALVGTAPSGKEYIPLCVISRNRLVEVWCEVYGRTEGPEYRTERFFTEYDVWHTFRIEMLQDMTVIFYIDGDQVGSYKPADAEEFTNTEFKVRLEAYSDEGDGIVAHFDDVFIGNK